MKLLKELGITHKTPSFDLPPIRPAFGYLTGGLSLGINGVFYEEIGQITRISRPKDDMDRPVSIRLQNRMDNYDFIGVIRPVDFQESGYSVHAPPFPPVGVKYVIPKELTGGLTFPDLPSYWASETSEVAYEHELRNARSGSILTGDGSEGRTAADGVRDAWVVQNCAVQDVKVVCPVLHIGFAVNLSN